MRHLKRERNAQTFVFFLVSFSTVFLLCGMGLDLGLWFLDRTRLTRACDAAAITGAANFGKTTTGDPETGRRIVAAKMREVAVANYYGLRNIADSNSPVRILTTNSSGGTNYNYYFMNSNTNEAGYHVTIATGLEGQVTLARSEAWTKTKTVFMGFSGISQLMQLNTKSSVEAKRRPRLIVLIIDRSGSMVSNGGSSMMEAAVTNFLGLMKNDAQNNQVGIVSFSSFGRVEMTPTTNFWKEGTNKMYMCTSTSKNLTGLKFNGNTGADEGMRLALELMRTNQGWTDPQTYKFIVFFTDGEFNIVRTMLAAPAWTNALTMATGSTPINDFTNNQQSLPFSSFWPNNANGFRYVMATASDSGKPRALTNTISMGVYTNSSNQKINSYPAFQKVVLNPGWMSYTWRASGARAMTWASNVNNSANYIKLAAGDTVLQVAPGYVLDAIFNPGSASSGPGSPSYISGCGYNAFKATDGGESYGYVYPDGIYISWQNSSTYTNLHSAGGPDGELFYNQYNGVTQEIKSASEWKRNMPYWITNYDNAMTNYTTPGGSLRYYAAAYTGLAKPSGWIEDGGSATPSNTAPGGIYYSNSLASQYTNINTMAINGGPTHYYDFRVGGWSNFTTWSTGTSAMATPMCQWKVMTYCDMARLSDVTLYTVGFDGANENILRSMANDRNATNYRSNMPTGRYYFADSPADIVTDFTQIAQQILAFISK